MIIASHVPMGRAPEVDPGGSVCPPMPPIPMSLDKALQILKARHAELLQAEQILGTPQVIGFKQPEVLWSDVGATEFQKLVPASTFLVVWPCAKIAEFLSARDVAITSIGLSRRDIVDAGAFPTVIRDIPEIRRQTENLIGIAETRSARAPLRDRVPGVVLAGGVALALLGVGLTIFLTRDRG